MSHNNKTLVWITGASQGIGEAVAQVLAQQGINVAASARNAERLQALARQSENLSGRIIPYPLDVTDPAAVKATVSQIEQDLGPIDQAILNAGTFIEWPAQQFTSTNVRMQVELNLMGTCHCLEPLIATMKERGRGTIAINASLAGYRGLPKAAGYGASKAALINMAESLHTELTAFGIHIKLINPGFVQTPLTGKNQFPMPFLMAVEPAAHCIVKGMNHRGFEIRFPWIFACFMGCLRHLPYSLYFWLVRKAR